MSLNHITGQTKPKSKSFSQEKTGNFTGSSKRGSKKSKYGKKQGQRKGQKPLVAPRAPVKEYSSLCCSMPAVKPKAGRKEMSQDPESKKTKEITKGLGHWRCGQCGKPCKVKVQTPAPKELITAHIMMDIKVPVTVDAAKFEGVPFENVATLPA